MQQAKSQAQLDDVGGMSPERQMSAALSRVGRPAAESCSEPESRRDGSEPRIDRLERVRGMIWLQLPTSPARSVRTAKSSP